MLTDLGRKTADDLFNDHAKWIAALFAGFTTEERKTLNGYLQRIWRNLETGAEHPARPEERT